jgi:hypothetical protein
MRLSPAALWVTQKCDGVAHLSEGAPRGSHTRRAMEKNPIICYTDRLRVGPGLPPVLRTRALIMTTSPAATPLRRGRFVRARHARSARAEKIPFEPESRRNAEEFMLRRYERNRQRTCEDDPLPQRLNGPRTPARRAPHVPRISRPKKPIEPESRGNAGQFAIRGWARSKSRRCRSSRSTGRFRDLWRPRPWRPGDRRRASSSRRSGRSWPAAGRRPPKPRRS